MLEIEKLRISYGDTVVVEDLTLALDDSEILTLVGPTGCGKTTILRAVAGLVPVADGEIRLGEHRIDRHHCPPPEKRNVGMVFQDFALFPHLDVARNIGFRLRDKKVVDHWLRTLDLEPWRSARPDTLSGGQKQRVALARALAHAPGLMLLDEPLSNLDAALKDSLRWTIREALKEAEVPAIWVTHDQDEAMTVGDRIGILNRGTLEQIGTPEECFSRPASRFVAEFLGEACFLPGSLSGNRAETSLGAVEAIPIDGASGKIDLLVRPDDLSISPDGNPNARIAWSRFEGGSRLYGARLDGSNGNGADDENGGNDQPGGEVRIRVLHEEHYEPGETVRVALSANHPLVAFARNAPVSS